MSDRPTLLIDPSVDPCPARAALVWAVGMPGCASTAEMPGFLKEILDRVAAGESLVPAERKAAVRDMLRHGAYKPSGRSKPASEYLLGAAVSGSFPLVNPPVDVNNAVSLQWGYPASIFDADRSGRDLL
ncbi:MAG TPA: hypothetical protein VFI08_07565, partial [Spirochaetia bacterium]|nr:hypothetical protein [Spirochaetia bacterium]